MACSLLGDLEGGGACYLGSGGGVLIIWGPAGEEYSLLGVWREGMLIFGGLVASLLEGGGRGERGHPCVGRLGCPIQRGCSVLSEAGGVLWDLLAAGGAQGLEFLGLGVLTVWGLWERELEGGKGTKRVKRERSGCCLLGGSG